VIEPTSLPGASVNRPLLLGRLDMPLEEISR
jgi:hypothetical protein